MLDMTLAGITTFDVNMILYAIQIIRYKYLATPLAAHAIKGHSTVGQRNCIIIDHS